MRVVTKTLCSPRSPQADLVEKIVDLPLGGANHHLGVDQARGPNDLLHHLSGARDLEFARSRRKEHHLVGFLEPLVEPKWPIVLGGWEPEAVLDQHLFAGTIPLELPTDLRDRHVGLVDNGQIVLREIVEQGVRGFARGPPVEMAGVVLDPRAEPDLTHHLEVVIGSHPKPLCLQQLPVSFKLGEPATQLLLD